jgi:hypothetical protein
MWQKILRLQDWKIQARFAKTNEMSKPNNQGEVSYNITHREALIKLLKPEDYPAACVFPQDIDATLAHELLHVQFSTTEVDMDDDSTDYLVYHQSIEATAKGLAELYHRVEASRELCQIAEAKGDVTE